MADTRKAARLNGFVLEHTFARRKTKDGMRTWSMVAVNRCFHGGMPRGEPSLKRLMQQQQINDLTKNGMTKITAIALWK